MKKKRKKNYVLPVTGGFLALYFAIMVLATFLVKEKFLEDFAGEYETRLGRMIQDIGEFEQALWRYEQALQQEEDSAQGEESSSRQESTTGVFGYGTYTVLQNAYSGEMRQTHYEALLAQNLNLMSTKYQQFSGAVYGKDGELIAKSENRISLSGGFTQETGQYEMEYPLADFLSQEEILTLAGYAQEAENGGGTLEPGPYRITVMVAEPEKEQEKSTGLGDIQDISRAISGNWELSGIAVQKITWQEGSGMGQTDPLTGSSHSWQAEGGKVYRQTDSEIVWEWTNPEIEGGSHTVRIPLSIWQSFPYLIQGYDNWKRWTESEFLHDFPERIEAEKWKDGTVLSRRTEGFTAPRFGSKYQFDFSLPSEAGGSPELFLTSKESSGQGLCLVLLSESHPWLAAMDYMRYAYMGSFLFLLVCIAIIVCVTGRMYEKRALLEESRRDFTNTIAHELKTPLGIIRGMAENLREHAAPEKTDYYIGNIIGQTEEIDRLVAEMIYTSKLDSEAFVLKREPLCWRDLVEQQIEKFAPLIEKKKIYIRYAGETASAEQAKDGQGCKSREYDLEGDRGCLEKAVWNLLSNAVHWCRPEGTITITLEKGFCSIENTGPQIGEEHLPHIFEMFYHGEDGNLGMGLYLTRRIAELHGLKLRVENTAGGVKSVIEK